jgi:hypothetical protein
MNTPEHNEFGVPSRRTFLKTVVAAGGATAIGLGAGAAMAGVRDEPQPESSAEELGYRETRHIRDYYARAKF